MAPEGASPWDDSMDLDTCSPEERREALSAWLDGELSADEARAVESWLAAHPEEARTARAMRRTWDLLATYEDEPVPEGFAERVLAAAGSSGRGSDEGAAPARLRVLRGGPGWKPLAAAAVLLLAVAAGYRWITRPGEPVGPAAPETAALLDRVPPDVLEQADVLLSLSEEEFRALLEIDPDEVEQGG